VGLDETPYSEANLVEYDDGDEEYDDDGNTAVAMVLTIGMERWVAIWLPSAGIL
jgi:hypothetical protein